MPHTDSMLGRQLMSGHALLHICRRCYTSAGVTSFGRQGGEGSPANSDECKEISPQVDPGHCLHTPRHIGIEEFHALST